MMLLISADAAKVGWWVVTAVVCLRSQAPTRQKIVQAMTRPEPVDTSMLLAARIDHWD